MLGLIMVFGTTSAELIDVGLTSNVHKTLVKQLAFCLASILMGLCLFYIGLEKLLILIPYCYYSITFLLLLVLIPGIGQMINGARRWIGFGFISFQPSELLKLLMPLYCINYCYKNPITTFKNFFSLSARLLPPLCLVLLEPDNGTVVILVVIMIALFFLMRIPWLYYIVPCLLFVSAGVIYAACLPHVRNRVYIYLHPEKDLQGKGHQPYQAKIAAGSGGLTGKGLGKSFQKFNYLPEARSDYIAAIFAEEFGFIGVLLLICLYFSMMYGGISISVKCFNIQHFYITAILTFLIVFQAFLNLGVVSGLLPSKGTNLPFFSQGGSSLLCNILIIFTIITTANNNFIY